MGQINQTKNLSNVRSLLMLLNISISNFGIFMFVVSSTRFIVKIIIILIDSLKLSSFFFLAWPIGKITFFWQLFRKLLVATFSGQTTSHVIYLPTVSYSTGLTILILQSLWNHYLPFPTLSFSLYNFT